MHYELTVTSILEMPGIHYCSFVGKTYDIFYLQYVDIFKSAFCFIRGV